MIPAISRIFVAFVRFTYLALTVYYITVMMLGFQLNRAVKIQWGIVVAAAIWEFFYAYIMRTSGEEYYKRMETRDRV